jgi:hypothetical protein
MRPPFRLFALLASVLFLLSPATRAQSASTFAATEAAGSVPRDAWLYFDAPLWDIANEGLPFRLTLALPSQRDPLTRVLFAAEARWTVSVGYAKVYNSYDAATGIFKNPGGHAALVSAGRQFRWHFPAVLGPFTPKLAIEFGAHYATRRFPADGTRANFKLITGLEWTWLSRDRASEWSAGVMWPHFSNANLFERNAGYDGLALRFGRTIRF